MTIQKYLMRYLEERPLFLSLIRAKEAELYSRFLPLKKPILDVGCGDGFFAHLVFGRVTIGLDVAGSRIREASASGTYDKTLIYDGKRFPFRANRFATVVSNCVLEHVAEVNRVVTHMYRVLRPGGKALISVMAKPWEDHLAGSIVLGNAYRKWMRRKQVHVHLLTEPQWRTMFTKAEFQVENVIGYLSPRACRLIDIAHYLSLPSLLSYIVCKKWVLWKPMIRWYPVRWLASIILADVPSRKAGALFFVLRKL